MSDEGELEFPESAQRLFDEGRLEEAYTEFEKHRLRPEPLVRLQAYLGLGVVETRKGNHYHAIHNFTKALEIDGENTSAWYGLGSSYQSVGNHTKANFCFEMALSKNPQHEPSKRAKKRTGTDSTQKAIALLNSEQSWLSTRILKNNDERWQRLDELRHSINRCVRPRLMGVLISPFDWVFFPKVQINWISLFVLGVLPGLFIYFIAGFLFDIEKIWRSRDFVRVHDTSLGDYMVELNCLGWSADGSSCTTSGGMVLTVDCVGSTPDECRDSVGAERSNICTHIANTSSGMYACLSIRDRDRCTSPESSGKNECSLLPENNELSRLGANAEIDSPMFGAVIRREGNRVAEQKARANLPFFLDSRCGDYRATDIVSPGDMVTFPGFSACQTTYWSNYAEVTLDETDGVISFMSSLLHNFVVHPANVLQLKLLAIFKETDVKLVQRFQFSHQPMVRNSLGFVILLMWLYVSTIFIFTPIKFLDIIFQKYEFKDNRLILHRGLLNRTTKVIELHRVTTVEAKSLAAHQIFGISNLVIKFKNQIEDEEAINLFAIFTSTSDRDEFISLLADLIMELRGVVVDGVR